MECAVGIPAQKLVLSEIHSLICGLRTNTRFANKSRFYEVNRNHETKIMLKLKDLYNVASTKTGWQTLSIMDVLEPFFEVIKSEETTGPITGIALQSIQKFLEHPCISVKAQAAKYVMEEIVKSVKLCQFEVTDAVTDEAVLNKILQIFVLCVQCECGVLLDESQILEILKSCFRIGRETRPTELLKRSAENSLQEIIECTFKRVRNKQWQEMPIIFDFVIDLVDPEKEGKSFSLRLLGLTLVISVLEIMGTQITLFPNMLKLLQDSLCKSLLRNAVGTTNLVLLSQTLRAMHHVITCAAPYIHDQMECFIVATYLKLAEQKQHSHDYQELVLESLSELCSDGNLMYYIYEHFDCTPYSTNLFESICLFLAKMIKDSDSMNTLHILALNGLLGMVKGIAERTQYASEETPETAKSLEQIRKMKETKKKMMEIANVFNNNPKLSFKMLEEMVSPNEKLSAKNIAIFMKDYSQWLSKAAIGECLKMKSEYNDSILEEYMNSFEFKGLTIDQAIRYVVSYFMFSGEGQQIEKMLKYFAQSYFNQNPDCVYKSSETAWAFSVAVMMLHTDLHSQHNRNKMMLPQWLNNVKLIDDKSDIPPEEAERVYHAIAREEFQYSTGFSDVFKSKHAWNLVLSRSAQYYSQRPHAFEDDTVIENPILDVDMFQKTHGSITLASAIVIDTVDDDFILKSAITGYLDCARICATYKLTSIFDNLVISLCNPTKILTPHHENAVTSFGQSEKSQLCAKTVFAITRKHGDHMREAWKNVLDLILRMYELDLLPESIIERESFLHESRHYSKPEKKKNSPSPQSTGSIWSSLFGSSDDHLMHQQAREKTVQCIDQCRIPEMLNDAKYLHDSASLEYLIKALILSSGATEETSIEHRDIYTRMFCLDLLIDITISNKDRVMQIWKHVFDFIKMILANVITKFNDKGGKLTTTQIIIFERVVISILRLYVRMIHREDVRIQLDAAMDLLNSIPETMLTFVLPQICSGILMLVKTNSKNLTNVKIWDTILRFLRLGVTDKDSIAKANEATTLIATEGDFVWPDNIISCVNSLMAHVSLATSEIFFSLHSRMFDYAPSVSNPSPAWTKSWFTIVEAVTKLCVCNDKEIRNLALGQLQRIMLDKRLLSLPNTMVDGAINKSLFVLMEDMLLKMKSAKDLDKLSLSELRLRALNLVAKSFLQLLPGVQGMPEFDGTWSKLLKYMQQYYLHTESDILKEAVPELIKNMLLVMNANEIFVNKPSLWTMTKQQIDAFVPNLTLEVTINLTNKPANAA